jgi:diaminohydroxyphosphoribosylaminopyrimidine deaminase/5-amino-6-(5-phosphoribosylamino)uracil reductase
LIVSSRAVVPPRARVFEGAPKPPVWVACTRRARPRTVARLTRRGAEIIMCKEEGGRVSLDDLLGRLGERNVTSLLVEGGQELLGGFFDRGLVDRVVAVTAPKIIGGKRAKSPVGGRGVGRLEDAGALREMRRRSLGDDVLLEGYVADVDDYFANVKFATERLRKRCRSR